MIRVILSILSTRTLRTPGRRLGRRAPTLARLRTSRARARRHDTGSSLSQRMPATPTKAAPAGSPTAPPAPRRPARHTGWPIAELFPDDANAPAFPLDDNTLDANGNAIA